METDFSLLDVEREYLECIGACRMIPAFAGPTRFQKKYTDKAGDVCTKPTEPIFCIIRRNEWPSSSLLREVQTELCGRGSPTAVFRVQDRSQRLRLGELHP